MQEFKLAQTVCEVMLDKVKPESVRLPRDLAIPNLFETGNAVEYCYAQLVKDLKEMQDRFTPTVGDDFTRDFANIMNDVDALLEAAAPQIYLYGRQMAFLFDGEKK